MLGSLFLLGTLLLAYLGALPWAYPLGAWGFLAFYLVWYGVARLTHRDVT